MHIFRKHQGLALAAALLAPAAFAQTAPPAPQPGQNTATPPIAPPPFVSAFSGYRAHMPEPVGSWPEANQRVRDIGGWRAYAREAAQPEAAEPGPHVHSEKVKP